MATSTDKPRAYFIGLIHGPGKKSKADIECIHTDIAQEDLDNLVLNKVPLLSDHPGTPTAPELAASRPDLARGMIMGAVTVGSGAKYVYGYIDADTPGGRQSIRDLKNGKYRLSLGNSIGFSVDPDTGRKVPNKYVTDHVALVRVPGHPGCGIALVGHPTKYLKAFADIYQEADLSVSRGSETPTFQQQPNAADQASADTMSQQGGQLHQDGASYAPQQGQQQQQQQQSNAQGAVTEKKFEEMSPAEQQQIMMGLMEENRALTENASRFKTEAAKAAELEARVKAFEEHQAKEVQTKRESAMKKLKVILPDFFAGAMDDPNHPYHGLSVDEVLKNFEQGMTPKTTCAEDIAVAENNVRNYEMLSFASIDFMNAQRQAERGHTDANPSSHKRPRKLGPEETNFGHAPSSSSSAPDPAGNGRVVVSFQGQSVPMPRIVPSGMFTPRNAFANMQTRDPIGYDAILDPPMPSERRR